MSPIESRQGEAPRRGTLLLVESDVHVSELLVAVLGDAGYQVEAVTAVAEAWPRLEEHRIDIVLIGVTVGMTDAFDLMKRLRTLDRDTALVFVPTHAIRRAAATPAAGARRPEENASAMEVLMDTLAAIVAGRR